MGLLCVPSFLIRPFLVRIFSPSFFFSPFLSFSLFYFLKWGFLLSLLSVSLALSSVVSFVCVCVCGCDDPSVCSVTRASFISVPLFAVAFRLWRDGRVLSLAS